MRKTQTSTTALGLADLRLLRAIARHGSLGGAARALAVDHSSAFRRLAALERRLGVRLFDRSRQGYRPTAAGEAAITAAARVAGELEALERQLLGQDLRLSGPVRLTTTDTLLHLLAPLLARFRAREPGIVVEVIAANALFDLSRRDADLALRPIAAVPEHLVARRAGAIATAFYAAPDYLQRAGERALDAHDWIALDASLAHLGSARWIAAHVASECIVHRADSLLAVQHATRAGLGLGALPCYLGDADAGLQRVAPPLDAATVPLWLITHPDLRGARRVAALSDFLLESLRAMAPLLSGMPAGPRPARGARLQES